MVGSVTPHHDPMKKRDTSSTMDAEHTIRRVGFGSLLTAYVRSSQDSPQVIAAFKMRRRILTLAFAALAVFYVWTTSFAPPSANTSSATTPTVTEAP